jgi:2-polyprenyl-3-methyl-5-hydroxy-6-metoxy-1,4-benzoquinol methylase
MPEPQISPKFDSVAADYSRLHAQNVAASGEGIEYFAQYKVSCLKRMGVTRGDRVLDYGCGIGNITRLLVQHFDRVTGYDPSSESLAMARAAVPEASFHADLAELLTDTFDVAVLSGVLHHVPKGERIGVLRSVLGLLRPGGRVVIFEHNPYNPLTRHAVDTCPFDDDAVLLAPRELRRLLAEAQCVDRWQKYIVFFPRLLRLLRPLEPALGFFPLGAQTLTVGARR